MRFAATMGNCIGINRNDSETLDTGSANVTRPVTGKFKNAMRNYNLGSISLCVYYVLIFGSAVAVAIVVSLTMCG